jgi:hypothetical protein
MIVLIADILGILAWGVNRLNCGLEKSRTGMRFALLAIESTFPPPIGALEIAGPLE